MFQKSKILLCILDGWGLSTPSKYNAIDQADTPCWNQYWQHAPSTTLTASAEAVGLPSGQMGNSEVGHTNIGAGRIVEQILPKIDRVLTGDDQELPPALQKMFAGLVEQKSTLHLFGILSEGRVHGSLSHTICLARAAYRRGIPVKIHGMADGRDCSPRVVYDHIQKLNQEIPEVSLTTLIGRYYAMDRDQRWARTERAWQLWQYANGEYFSLEHFKEYLSREYSTGKSDEFLPACVFDQEYKGIQQNDFILMTNFRIDRMKQIMQVICDPNFAHFTRGGVRTNNVYTMVSYGAEFSSAVPLFLRENVQTPLGEVLADAGLTQLRIAETEKFPHVTYFFNGGEETPFTGEEHCLIPSPKVASYDLAPEMSATQIGDAVIAALHDGDHALIVVNFANPDMVGHTGDLAAVCQAVEHVDQQLARILKTAKQHDVTALVTADHGNAEMMWDDQTNQPHTAHTTNLVPLILIKSDDTPLTLKQGVLGDIAPTILELLGIDQPDLMSGSSLIKL